jgi:hypothetical protein
MPLEVPGRQQFRLRKSPLTLGQLRATRPGTLVADKNLYVSVPAFVAAFPEWPDASYIVARIILNVGTPWSIVFPAPISCNACVCVRWTIGGVTYRYKLWRDVGEVLAYPLYGGEILPETGVYIEFWCINDGLTAVTLPSAWYIKTSALQMPDSCCDSTTALIYTGPEPCITHTPPATVLDDYFTHCV